MDTNQIIAGSLWPAGPAGFILEKWRESKMDIIVSPAIMDEVERVMIENFNAGRETADYLKRVFAYRGRYVEPKEKIDAVKNDPSDNIFLEAAVEGGADFIVTRDNDILRLKNFRGIEIVQPESMANWIRKNVL